MYKSLKLIVFVALLPLVVAAQEQPKATIFGGYSYLRNGGNNAVSSNTLGGSNSLNGVGRPGHL
jgi:hypothetical protein